MAEVKLSNDPVANQLRQQYPSNSITAQPQEPKREKVEPVVKSKTIIQKESLGARLKKAILPGDIKDIKHYALHNVIIPGLKSGCLALIEMAFYGQVRGNRGVNVNQRTNYSYSSTSSSQYSRQPVSQRDRASHNFSNIIFETYSDAEDVISTLLDILDRAGAVTVADFYEASGQTPDWADVDWGWTRFQRLEPRAIRGGYIIDVTPPILLRR